MPNIKSAIKRVSVIEHKTLRNKMVKSATKTAIKKFDAATASKTATAEMLSSAGQGRVNLSQSFFPPIREGFFVILHFFAKRSCQA